MGEIFDGIGTEIIGLIFSAVVVGTGYKVVKKQKSKQIQKVGKNSTAYQAGRDIKIG